MVNKLRRYINGKLDEKKISIKFRILANIIFLVTVVFLAIIIAFNILVNQYIKSSADEQLTKAKVNVETIDKIPRPMKPPENQKDQNNDNNANDFTDFMKDVQDKVRLAEIESDVNAMVLDQNYNLLFPNRNNDFFKDINEMESLNSELKSEKSNLNSSENRRISSRYGDYYYSSIDITGQGETSSEYLVMFIDITSMMTLAKRINIVLILVMCFAEALSIVIASILSEKIARPIKELSVFARQIGEGDFSTRENKYLDEELSDLFTVMNKSAEYLDKYDKEQKVFFQNASHELRTPLMSIKGYAEAIKYDVIEKNEATEIILEESDRLSDMVEDLLYISKVDNITKSYIIVESDLREILSNCAIKLNARAINSGIEFVYEFDENPVIYECDEKYISRAFFNLIDNCLRYAKKNIFIRCNSDENNIVVEIEDDGEGIPKEDLPHILDRFYKGKGGKHGIGLSIVDSIVSKHGGSIKAQNGEKGALFTICFPRIH